MDPEQRRFGSLQHREVPFELGSRDNQFSSREVGTAEKAGITTWEAAVCTEYHELSVCSEDRPFDLMPWLSFILTSKAGTATLLKGILSY